MVEAAKETQVPLIVSEEPRAQYIANGKLDQPSNQNNF